MAYSYLPRTSPFVDPWEYSATRLWGPYLDDMYQTPPSFLGGLHPKAKSSGTQSTKDKFRVMLNVSHFKPGEVEVKIVDKDIVVHAKHEERSDDHGYIKREFTRRYALPEGIDDEKFQPVWNPDGLLIIEAPMKETEVAKSNEFIVPITVTKPLPEDLK